MVDQPTRDRMRALEERIARAKGSPEPEDVSGGIHSRAEVAWRMVIELVAGLLIGLGIGYGLDWLLGTIPVFLVAFTLLGFAAGVKTMMRSAREMMADQAVEEDEKRGDRS